ncbi:MAG: preprotein translocase subunit SecG [Planctomycetota bacterium]|jgi:preprotein translocase subunit SecG
MTLLTTVLYIVFVLAAIILITVVLLQEGKGGGLGSALGESGQQTIGVGAKGINTFTGYVAGTFIVTALLLHMLNRSALSDSIIDDDAWATESMQDALGGGGSINPLEGLGLPPGSVPTDG